MEINMEEVVIAEESRVNRLVSANGPTTTLRGFERVPPKTHWRNKIRR